MQRPLSTLLAQSAALLLCAASIAQSTAPTLSAPVRAADKVLSSAETAAGAARQWLRDSLSNEAVEGYVSSARGAVQDRFDGALEEARVKYVNTLGLFEYSMGCEAPEDPWVKLDAAGPLPARVVLLVHGLDEGGTIWDDAAPAITGAGYTVLRFNYPNDQPIARSADALAQAFRELRLRGVASVDVIGHSMGGLVARDVLTRDDYYHGDARGDHTLPAISRFIMLGTPNQGSPLAHFRAVMEVRDQIVHWVESDDKSVSSMLGFMVDGDGEAGDDLFPGSPFLTELNARALPEHVRITIVAAELGSVSRQRIASTLENAYVVRVLGQERVSKIKHGTLGVCDDVGDGCVSGSSSRLDGVDDFVAVDANHRTMIRTMGPVPTLRAMLGYDNPSPPAIPIILNRLAQP